MTTEERLQLEWLATNKPKQLSTPPDIYVYVDGFGRIVVGKSENRVALRCKRFGTKRNRQRNR